MAKASGGKTPERTASQTKRHVRGRSASKSAGRLKERCTHIGKHKTKHAAKTPKKKQQTVTTRFRVLPPKVPVLLGVVS